MGARAAAWLQAMSFRGRLLALLLVIAALQVVASGMTFHELQSAPVQQRAERQLADAVETTLLGHVDTSMERSRERLQLLATDPALQHAIVTRDKAAVGGLLEAAGDPGEHVRVKGPGGVPLVDAAEGDAVTIEAASLPLRRDGRVVGTLYADVVFDSGFLQSASRLVSSVPFVVKGTELQTAGGSERLGEELSEGVQRLTIDGRDQLAYLVRIPSAEEGWIGAAIPASRIAQERSEGRSGLVLFLVILVVLMVLVSILVTSAIGHAVGAFGRVASRLASGQLDERIPVTGDDEMARVSIAFNTMADQLQQRIATLEHTEGRLRRQLQHFGDVLGQSGAIGEILETVCRASLDTTSATRARFWTRDASGAWARAACIGLRVGDAEPLDLELQCSERGHAIAVGEGPQWLAVPSMSGGEVLGILTLVRDDGILSAEDARMVEHLARQAAAAIDTARLHELQREQARRDGLTGLSNHRHMQDVLLARVREHQEDGIPVGVVLLDVDNFKSINDTYGHDVGDRALKRIAAVLDQPLCTGGLSARYGGEEFVVILPGLDIDATLLTAERLREGIRSADMRTRDGALQLTASFGVSHVDVLDPSSVSPATLLSTADEALYVAKRSGKDRVVLGGAPNESEYSAAA